jgi:hypothetical protein
MVPYTLPALQWASASRAIDADDRLMSSLL